jgi:hypothetical protein
MPSNSAPASVAPTDPDPPLSTLVLPNYEMGQKAAETLIDMAPRQDVAANDHQGRWSAGCQNLNRKDQALISRRR